MRMLRVREMLALGAAVALWAPAVATADLLREAPYVGGQLGWADFNHESSSPVTDIDGAGASGIMGGVYGGYRWPVGNGFMAVEANLALNSAKYEESAGDFRAELESKESYGIALLGGGMVANTLLYGRVGWQRTKIDLSGRDAVGSFSDDETFDGLRLGLGAEIPLQQQLSLRLDWSRTAYGDETFRIDGGRLDVDPEETLFTVGVTYRF